MIAAAALRLLTRSQSVKLQPVMPVREVNSQLLSLSGRHIEPDLCVTAGLSQAPAKIVCGAKQRIRTGPESRSAQRRIGQENSPRSWPGRARDVRTPGLSRAIAR